MDGDDHERLMFAGRAAANLREAAASIAALSEENERLRAALEPFANRGPIVDSFADNDSTLVPCEWINAARRALGMD